MIFYRPEISNETPAEIPSKPDIPKDTTDADKDGIPTPPNPTLSSSSISVFNLGTNEKVQNQEPTKKWVLDKNSIEMSSDQQQLGKSPKPRRVLLTKVNDEVDKATTSPVNWSGSQTKAIDDSVLEDNEVVSISKVVDEKQNAANTEEKSKCEATEVKEDTTSNLAESRYDVEEPETVSESPELMTPPKRSSKSVEKSLAQEVTPPKGVSQSQIERKVMVTPVIKLQKMSVMDILRYSPTADSNTFARLDVDSSPKVFSSKKVKQEGRFKRHQSQEVVRSSPRSKRSSLERSSSFDGVFATTKDGQSSAAGGVAKQQGLLTSQADLAELAERFELDGIEPLEDESDGSQTEASQTGDNPAEDKTPGGSQANAEVPIEKASAKSTDTSESSDEADAKQRITSEESMDFLDSQEELIPVADCTIETESEYATADELENDDICTPTKEASVVTDTIDKKADGDNDAANKEGIVMSTVEELREPDLNKTTSNSSVTPDGLEEDQMKHAHNDTIDLVSQPPENEVSFKEVAESVAEDSKSLLAEKRRGQSKADSARSSKRLRKNNVSLDDSDKSGEDPINKSSSESTSQNSCEGIEVSQKKRGRGRPKKAKQNDGNSHDESVVESQSSDDQSFSKKKRGRPRKMTGSPKKTDTRKEECQDQGETTSRKDDKKSCVNKTVSQTEGNGKNSTTNGESQMEGDGGEAGLENSCEDMFGSYNPDDATGKTSSENKAPEDKDEEDSVAVIGVKITEPKRRSFTKLSRKRKRKSCTWDEDDDIPLATISHSYLDVESQSSEDSDAPAAPKTVEDPEKSDTLKTKSESISASDKETAKDQSPVVIKKRRTQKVKSPQAIAAKRVLRRALKSPLKGKASPTRRVSPLKSKQRSTPVSNGKSRSPVATRLRAGKLTPKSARQLLAGKRELSPEDFAKSKVKRESRISKMDPESKEEDDSFDLPLNQYVKKNRSPVATRSSLKNKSATIQKNENTSNEDSTTPGGKKTSKDKVNEEKLPESKTVITEVSQSITKENLTDMEVDDIVNSSQTPDKLSTEVDKAANEAKSSPKVGQTLQTLPQRLQFVSGINSPTECNTPPENTSPVVPHKFSPRSCSSPVEFAMRRGGNQGSPRHRRNQGSPRQGSPKQRFSPVVCDIPGVFSPAVSPSTGILKRQDSPSPSNKVRLES